MKKFITLSLLLYCAHSGAQEILCTGLSNDNALVELEVNINAEDNSIEIENNSYELSANNEFSLSWSNQVGNIVYNNILSKITGDMAVIALDQNTSSTTTRASLKCVMKANKVIM